MKLLHLAVVLITAPSVGYLYAGKAVSTNSTIDVPICYIQFRGRISDLSKLCGAKSQQVIIARLLETKKCQTCDLHGFDLSNIDLNGVDLRSANLRGIELTGSSLSRANLAGADLSGTDLTGVNLRGTVMPDGTVPYPLKSPEF